MKLRVIHVITRLILGGAQENTILTAEGQIKRYGYDVLIAHGPPIGPEGQLIGDARRRGIPLLEIPPLRREISPRYDIEAFVWLLRLFRRQKPHVVHTHSSKAGIIARAAARMTGVPCIVHTIHGLPFHPYEKPGLNLLYRLLERVSAIYTDRIIAVCRAMMDKALEAGVGKPERYTVIYSAVEQEMFEPIREVRERVRKELGVAEDSIIIGKVSRLAPLKGHEYLIDAFARITGSYPTAKLLLIGEGVLRREIEVRVRNLGLQDRVILTGLVSPGKVAEYLQAMDVVVHVSLREGLARVLPQALLCVKPVIAFDIDGAHEVIVDGQTGLLVKPQSTEGLVEALVKVLSDMDKARQMASEGRKRVLEPFAVGLMVDRICRLYEEVCCLRRT